MVVYMLVADVLDCVSRKRRIRSPTLAGSDEDGDKGCQVGVKGGTEAVMETGEEDRREEGAAMGAKGRSFELDSAGVLTMREETGSSAERGQDGVLTRGGIGEDKRGKSGCWRLIIICGFHGSRYR